MHVFSGQGPIILPSLGCFAVTSPSAANEASIRHHGYSWGGWAILQWSITAVTTFDLWSRYRLHSFVRQRARGQNDDCDWVACNARCDFLRLLQSRMCHYRDIWSPPEQKLKSLPLWRPSLAGPAHFHCWRAARASGRGTVLWRFPPDRPKPEKENSLNKRTVDIEFLKGQGARSPASQALARCVVGCPGWTAQPASASHCQWLSNWKLGCVR